MQLLDSLPWTLSFFLLIIASGGITVLCILLGHKTAGVKDCSTATGQIFVVLSTLYIVILGFTLVNAQQNFEDSRLRMEQEIFSISNRNYSAALIPLE